jgi:hypothetical protein
VLCNYCNVIHPFCEDCLNKIDAYTGKFSKIDDECGETDDESSDDE